MKKVVGLLLAMTLRLMAEESTEFITHTELGYVSTSGNTNTKSGSLDFAGKQTIEKHSLKLDFDYLYGEESGVENNNKLITEINYDYRFAKHFTFNYLAGYKNDKFSGFEYQVYTGPGTKYIAVDNETHKLNFQANILYAKDVHMTKYYNDAQKLDDNETKYPYYPEKGTFETPGSTNEYGSYLIKGDYTWAITEGFKFIQELSYRGDFEDSDIYFVMSKTAVESKINGTFSMGVNYKVDYTNTPPEGNVRTDKTFTASLIIDY